MSRSFVIRLDLSPGAGLGHCTRCRVLADELCTLGATIAAVVYRGVPHAELAPLVGRGERLYAIGPELTPAEDARFVAGVLGEVESAGLVLDSYAVDDEYQQILEDAGVSWLQFDSHAAQPFRADWVLHASPGAMPELYEPLRTRPSTRFLLGPEFAIVGRVFRRAPRIRSLDGAVGRVFVGLGGGDDGGATLRVLHALAPVVPELERVDVVVGSANSDRQALEALLAEQPFAGIARLHVDTDEVHALMEAADLGVTSGGTISYEACASGLPQLLVCMADNQRMNCEGWERAGAALCLGDAATLRGETLIDGYTSVAGDPGRLRAMSAAGRSLVDGHGAQRVARELLDRGE